MKKLLLAVICILFIVVDSSFAQYRIDNVTGNTITDCQGTLLDSDNGTGTQYANNELYNVTISPIGASTVTLTFVMFDVEPGSGAGLCDYDTLVIYDGTSTADPVIGSYCNNNPPPATITSTGPSVYIFWDSDGAVTAEGFEITWKPTGLTTLAYVSQEINCNGDNNGELTAICSGTFPYNYIWTPGGQVTQTITNQNPGTYNVTVTDVNGCTSNASVNLTEPTALSESAVTTNVLCNGDCDGTATITSTGGTGSYTYKWDFLTTSNYTYNGITGTIADNTNNQRFDNIVSGLGIDLNGTTLILEQVCVDITHDRGNDLDIYIESPDATKIVLSSDNGGTSSGDYNVCFDMSAVTEIVAAGNAPFSGTYNPEGNMNTLHNNQNPNGTWVLEIDEDNSAGGSGTLNAWSLVFSETLPESSQTVTALCAGNYNVTITDANGCTIASGPHNVTEPLVLTVDAGVALPICVGESVNLTAIGNNGTPNYSFSWSSGDNTQTTTVTPASTTTYTVTITDDNGCTSTDIVTVTVNSLPTPSIAGNTPFCLGNSITLDAGAYNSWTWSTTETSQTINVSTTGTFTVTVTDANGCTATDAITTTVNSLPTPSITGNTPFCLGNSITLDAGAYNSWTWSTTETSQTINVSTTGTFTVTVTDANGCTATDAVTTTVNSLPTPSITGNIPFCLGNSITLDAGAYNSWTWSTTETSQTINVSTTGTFTVTVTDANGCTATDAVTTTVNSLPTPSITGNTPFCLGNSITLDAGTYSSWTWSTTETTQTINVSSAETYTVTVTDGNGCTATDAIVTTVNSLPIVSASSNSPVCEGDILTLTGGSDFMTSYNWSGPNTYSSTSQSPTVSGVATTAMAGLYTITVTNANSCTNTISTTVVVNTLPVVSFSMPQSTYTVNDPVSIIVTYNPVGGVFSGPGIMAVDSTFYPSTLSVGFYDIYYTYTDIFGCVGFDMQTVEIVPSGGSISGLPSDLCNYSAPVTLNANLVAPYLPVAFQPAAGLTIINDTVAIFDPALATVGIDTIWYVHSLDTIFAITTVHNISGQAILTGLDVGYCVDVSPLTLTGTPAGGQFLGTGITNSSLGTFDPATAGVGNTSVQYVISESVCTDTTIEYTDIYALPIVDFIPLNTVYNVAEPITTLSGNPLPIFPDTSYFYGNIGIANTGNGIADFNPAVAGVGSHTISYNYTDINGCSDILDLPITVNAANATIEGINMYNSENIYCYDGSADTLVGEPLFSISYDVDSSYFTLNGIRFAPGIDSIGVDSIIIYPNIIGPGNHILKYYYYDLAGSGAYFWVTENILIDSIGNINILTTDLEYCVSETQSEITGEIPLNCTGVFSYSGTSGGLIPATNTSAWFFPGTATVGNYDIYYECVNPSTGCKNYDTAQAFVYALPMIIGTDLQSTYNYNISYPQLSGNPSPGTFSGPGIISNTFYPTVAGLGGPYNITYTHTDINGCSNFITQQTYVINAQASIDGLPVNMYYCKDANDTSFTLHGIPDDTSAYQVGTGYFTINGVVNGTGIVAGGLDTIDIYPDSLNAGAYNLSYYYTDTSGTEFNVSYVIQIDSIGFAGFIGLNPEYCVDENTSILISEITTLVGTHYFSGPGVYLNGSQYEFDPSLAGANTLPYTITYEFTHTISGCRSSSTQNTIVHSLPALEIITDTSFCANDPSTMVYGTPAGSTGFLTGPGLISTGDTVLFNPAVVSGFVTIFYEYTDIVTTCSNNIDTVIHVKDVPQLNIIDIPSSLCLNAPLDTIIGTINSSIQGLGTFGGNGIVDNLDGTATFNPFVAGINSHEVFYTYVAGNACLDTVFYNILVHDIPAPTIDVTTTSLCENDVPIDLAGHPTGASGVYDIDGIITSLGEFDPSDYLPGNYPVSYTFTNIYGCSVTEYDTMHVHQVPYNLSFSPNMGCLNDTINFLGNANCSDAISDINWLWTLGVNIMEDTTNTLNPNEVFTDVGIFNVNLEVTSEFGCLETYNTGQIEIFDKPDIDFDWDKECFGDTTLFTNTPNGLFADSLVTWYFGDGDSLIGNNATHYYQLPGIYTVTINIENTAACMGTKSRTTVIREKVNTFPYFDDFEGATSSWYKETRDTVCSWLIGTPDSLPAYSGINTWNTSHDTLGYQENSSVISPCFDITGLKKPMITMKIWSKMRIDNDGAVLQYSVDYGEWENIGNINSGIHWYDSYSIDGMPGGQSIGWSNDTMSNWVDVRHDLDNVAGTSSCVRFRIAYGSDFNATGNDFAFDDVWIGERLKMVLFEHFTNASESECALYDPLIHPEFQSNSNTYDVIDIRFHANYPGSDQMNTDNPADQNARISFYSVPSQLPYSVIDGNQYYGATKTWLDYFNTLISTRSLEQPIFNIDLSTTKSSSSVSVVANIIALQQIVGKNVTFNVAVIEKEITSLTGANGMITFDNVVKKLLPDAAGTLFAQDWTNNQSENVTLTWDFQNVYNPAQVYVVAFIQDEDTKEVYQVISDDSSIVATGIEDLAIFNSEDNKFVLYPNPTSNNVTVLIAQPENYNYKIEIYNNIGELLNVIDVPNYKTLMSIDLSAFSEGLYLFKLNNNNSEIETKRLIIAY